MVGALYICRHGEREDWINSVWQEDADFPYDPPLSHDGMRHAQELGRRMARCVSRAGGRSQIDVIITSPFWRTLQTAGVANRWIKAPIKVMSELSPQITKKHKEFSCTPDIEYNSLPAKMLEFNFPGLQPDGPVRVPRFPETPLQLQERTHNAAMYLANELCVKKNMNVFVVTHRANAEQMTRALCGVHDPKTHALPGFCSLVKLEVYPQTMSWVLAYSHPGEKERHATNYGIRKFLNGSVLFKGEKGVEERFKHLKNEFSRTQGAANVVPIIQPMHDGPDDWDEGGYAGGSFRDAVGAMKPRSGYATPYNNGASTPRGMAYRSGMNVGYGY